MSPELDPQEQARLLLEQAAEQGVDRDGLLRMVDAALAPTNLCAFGRMVYEGFQAPKHIQYLAGLLERAERGEIKRLAISIAPGHGKSTLLQVFLAWFLGRDPRRRILALSASEKLAQRNSRAVRDMVREPGWPWPETQLLGEAIEEWYVNKKGGVRSIGRTGTVTGFRAEMVLVDDIQPDEGTENSRQEDEEWFRKILSTRLEPDGIAVVIQTRWHDADLIGRLAEGGSADQWAFVNIPVIATSDEPPPLSRREGEALWPERWPLDKLELRRAEVEMEGGSSAWSAQFMGDPVPSGGAMFAPEWLQHRYDEIPKARFARPTQREPVDAFTRLLLGDVGKARPLPPIRVQAIDCAAKTGVRNARTAIATVVTDLQYFYVEHVWADKVTFTQLEPKVKELYREFTPRTVCIEEASSGYALIDVLRDQPLLPVRGVKPGHDSKEARADALAPLFEHGFVKFPRRADWLQDAIHEFERFPHGRYKDIVDAVVIAIWQLQQYIKQASSEESWQRQAATISGDWMQR